MKMYVYIYMCVLCTCICDVYIFDIHTLNGARFFNHVKCRLLL